MTPLQTRIRLSPSRAGDFKQCPQLFKYRSIDKLEEPPTAATLRGSIVHRVLENLFGLEPSGRTPQAAYELIPTAIAEFADEFEQLSDAAPDTDSDEIEAAVREMVGNYFELEDPRRLNAIDRELRIEGTLDGVEIVGIIDRLDRADDGTYVITDYKTGKAPADKYSREAFFGLRIYALLLEQLHEIGVAPSKLRLLFLGSVEILEIDVDPGQLRGTAGQIAAIAGAIEAAISRDDWRTKTGPLCNWCHFKSICPAFND